MSLHKLSISDLQQFIQNKTDCNLKNIKHTSLNLKKIEGHNCEQIIGVSQVPLAIVGPAIINSQEFGKLEKYIPLSTTEGALIASIQRGLKTTRSGINTYSQNIGITRGPQISVKNIRQAQDIISYLEKNWSEFQQIVTATESHALLLKFTFNILGKNLYLKFFFDTGEAMGMNMATICTEKILEKIKSEFSNITYILSGNFCSDKKPSLQIYQEGRGKKVWAETILDKDLVLDILKTTPEKIIDIVNKKQHLGSIATSAISYNAHFANIVAAFYLATGQDLAHIVEGSLGITEAELDGENLHFSIYMPAVLVGTVGGGTSLPTQKESLTILGLEKKQKGDSQILAEILAAGVLAGELSLTAALATNDLVNSHQKLGRNKI